MAAEEVILSEGIGSLSLDAIAKRVGLSKSGLLHHFPSKDALIHGLVRLKCSQWKADCDEEFAEVRPGPFPTAQAFFDMCFGERDSFCEDCLRSSMVLVAALVHDPRHVAPIREVRRYLASRLANDGVPEDLAELLLLTIDGLWFGRLFGVAEPSQASLRAIREHLERLMKIHRAPDAETPTNTNTNAGRTKKTERAHAKTVAGKRSDKKETASVKPRRKKS